MDDAHSVLKYEIEVVNLQFNLEAEAAQVSASNNPQSSTNFHICSSTNRDG